MTKMDIKSNNNATLNDAQFSDMIPGACCCSTTSTCCCAASTNEKA